MILRVLRCPEFRLPLLCAASLVLCAVSVRAQELPAAAEVPSADSAPAAAVPGADSAPATGVSATAMPGADSATAAKVPAAAMPDADSEAAAEVPGAAEPGEPPAASALHTTDFSGRLRSTSGEDGTLFLSRRGDSFRTVVRNDETRIVLKKYDDRMRLVGHTIWNKGEESPAITVAYAYNGDSAVPVQKTEENTAEKTRTETAYNQAGKPVSQQSYLDAVLQYTREWHYDGDGRLVSEKTETGSNTATTEYRYTGNSVHPDTVYYENGTEQRRRIYLSDAEYTETISFGSELTVREHYRDGVKTEEVHLRGDTEIRRKVF